MIWAQYDWLDKEDDPDRPDRTTTTLKKRSLHKLFSPLPDALLNSRGGICWYCSAGIDRNVLSFFNHGDGVVGGVRLFLFTDDAYRVEAGRLHYPMGAYQTGGEKMPPWTRVVWGQPLIFHSAEGSFDAFLERVTIDRGWTYEYGEKTIIRSFWVIYIGVNNAIFERTAVANHLGIDVLCDAGGMRGTGPEDPCRLGVRYALAEWWPGREPARIDARPDAQSADHAESSPLIEEVMLVHWGMTGSGKFFKVTYPEETNPTRSGDKQ